MNSYAITFEQVRDADDDCPVSWDEIKRFIIAMDEKYPHLLDGCKVPIAEIGA